MLCLAAPAPVLAPRRGACWLRAALSASLADKFQIMMIVVEFFNLVLFRFGYLPVCPSLGMLNLAAQCCTAAAVSLLV